MRLIDWRASCNNESNENTFLFIPFLSHCFYSLPISPVLSFPYDKSRSKGVRAGAHSPTQLNNPHRFKIPPYFVSLSSDPGTEILPPQVSFRLKFPSASSFLPPTHLIYQQSIAASVQIQ